MTVMLLLSTNQVLRHPLIKRKLKCVMKRYDTNNTPTTDSRVYLSSLLVSEIISGVDDDCKDIDGKILVLKHDVVE